MLQWKRISFGVRPVPDPVTTPSVWAVTSLAALALVTAFNFLDQQGDATLDLMALSLLVALVSTGARFVAAPGTAVACWLILKAFATPPMGRLTWAAPYDLGRLACLLAAAGIGTAIARLIHARAAYRRLKL
ncbi:hypothetical protein [Streptomyces sp. NBC_01353]|uniref:hypothetical protein n=1 Tax=Streptomyces sp. NBC_01353 TaxID=2903835 RepID=UPI002E30A86B|nr:hypothetical protein [Streptomyces sp. NBC_01353]